MTTKVRTDERSRTASTPLIRYTPAGGFFQQIEQRVRVDRAAGRHGDRVCMGVRGGRFGDKSIAEGQLACLVGGRGDVVEQ